MNKTLADEPTSEMVEHVARAIFDDDWPDDHDRWGQAEMANVYRSQARVAIKVMMKPTDKMLEAADLELNKPRGQMLNYTPSDENWKHRAIYTAMIKAALGEDG